MSEFIISQAEFEERFPFPSLKQVLLYGSMVFAQDDVDKHSSPGNLVDCIFVVSDTGEFHEDNFRQNRRDYPFMLKLSSGFGLVGPWLSKSLQEDGAKTSYFTNIVIGGEHTKYGVIGLEDYVDDLENWTTLYMAGRAHKVQHVLHLNDQEERERIAQARQTNLRSAVRVGLLLNFDRDEITELDLIGTIMGISYIGDVRVKVGAKGQDKEKKLLRQIEGLRSMYRPVLEEMAAEGLLESKGMGDSVIITNRTSQDALAAELPQNLQEKLAIHVDGNIRQRLHAAISEINNENSTAQALKGVATAGIWTSLQYATAKLLKGKFKGARGERLLKAIFRL